MVAMEQKTGEWIIQVDKINCSVFKWNILSGDYSNQPLPSIDKLTVLYKEIASNGHIPLEEVIRRTLLDPEVPYYSLLNLWVGWLQIDLFCLPDVVNVQQGSISHQMHQILGGGSIYSGLIPLSFCYCQKFIQSSPYLKFFGWWTVIVAGNGLVLDAVWSDMRLASRLFSAVRIHADRSTGPRDGLMSRCIVEWIEKLLPLQVRYTIHEQ